MKQPLDYFIFKGQFLMLALDHRGTFKKLINPQNPETITDEEVINTKQQILEALLPLASGTLLDPEWGLMAFQKLQEERDKKSEIKDKSEEKPYLLCVEKTGYADSVGERVTELEYSPAKLKAQGAKGVKLLLYFNPYAYTAIKQLNTATTVFEECQKQDLPLFLELVTYPLERANSHKAELVLDSVNYFLEYGLKPDVFKLEYPGDPIACSQISRLLKKTPWILLTKGDNFEKFKQDLITAVKNGASGFLAGRSLWQGFSKLPKEQWAEYFNTVAKERFTEIVRICHS